jgi:hypothetical protein
MACVKVHSLMRQRENNLAISVAEDTKRLAMSASKENATMRLIQVITVLFLPATFLAVSSQSRYRSFREEEENPRRRLCQKYTYCPI